MTDTPNTPDASVAQNVQDTAARAAEAFGTLVETMAVARGTLSRLTPPSSATWWRKPTRLSRR